VGVPSTAVGAPSIWTTTVVGAPYGGAPAPWTSPAAAVLVGAPPPSGESTRETLIRRLDGGGDNGEKRLSLG
jgi:hypothetical protein